MFDGCRLPPADRPLPPVAPRPGLHRDVLPLPGLRADGLPGAVRRDGDGGGCRARVAGGASDPSVGRMALSASVGVDGTGRRLTADPWPRGAQCPAMRRRTAEFRLLEKIMATVTELTDAVTALTAALAAQETRESAEVAIDQTVLDTAHAGIVAATAALNAEDQPVVAAPADAAPTA